MRDVLGKGLAIVALSISAGCATGSTARFPLALGGERGVAEAALERQKLCRHEPKELQSQSYVRCKSKGFTIGESWLVVDYGRSDRVMRVRRLEHFPSHEGATKRWNELVGQRGEELGEESQAARDMLADLGEAPQGAVVWKAWQKSDTGYLHGIYLVKPEADDAPNVVEVLRRPAR